ncbi:MAG: 3-deoxy-manno-octulosonate cytidylyltransferase [Dysgonamonadaceae bacterium]|nr:3-deoxy-manno-octulosonate cytidylyltransferase [Dysgonamonadaceae bacterium]MDD4727502.1 3-deoxy-manno-octulosonate cytidylyltransferase [Dysgonamonadaceae bacterium]
MKFVAIIPARFASTRFPGKPLADMNGKPMIQRVYEQVTKSVADAYIATDDERIYKAVESFGGNVVMTSSLHPSGTDRCKEAYNKIEESYDVVLNIQGDEPFILPKQIDLLKACFVDSEIEIATLVKPFDPKDGIDVLRNPSSPKVVISENYEAIYFSRSIIPFLRDIDQKDWMNHHVFYKHIGIYGYRTDVLNRITQLPIGSLEKAESLEQLRWIENGFKIKVGVTSYETFGIDTPEDLKIALMNMDENSDKD